MAIIIIISLISKFLSELIILSIIILFKYGVTIEKSEDIIINTIPISLILNLLIF